MLYKWWRQFSETTSIITNEGKSQNYYVSNVRIGRKKRKKNQGAVWAVVDSIDRCLDVSGMHVPAN